MIQHINSTNAPVVVGPYSHAVIYNGLIFTSGQIGIDRQTNELASTIESQVEIALKNTENVLLECGSSKEKVLKTTLYIKNMGDYVLINKLYETFFNNIKPARSTVEVARLPKNALFEIDCVAYI